MKHHASRPTLDAGQWACGAGRALREASSVRRLASRAGDDRGVAALEGLLVFSLFAGLFLACLLLAQWGSSLQSAQMGARLLAFDAGDVALARLGKSSNVPVQQFTSENWDARVSTVTAGWLGGMFVLPKGSFLGSVTGTSSGRQPGQGSLFGFAHKVMGYHAQGWSAASDPWASPESVAKLTFTRIAYYVGLTRTSPSALDSTSARAIPPGNAVLETIYARAGR